MERPFHEYHDEMFRWYDYHLKGLDTGIMEEPPITFHISGVDEPRHEQQLVPERTQWEKLYFRSHGRLTESREPLEGSPTSFTQDPPTETNCVEAALFRSPPFTTPTEVTGPLEVRFHAAIDSSDTNWIVLLYAIESENTEPRDGHLLTRGYLKASHREVDPEQSRPAQPYHPHTDPVPVKEGQVYEYRIGLPPISHTFAPGAAMAVELRSLELPFVDESVSRGGLHYHLPPSESVTHRIYHDSDRPSRVVYPVVPAR